MSKTLRNCEAALARLLLQQRKTRTRLAKAKADIEVLDLKITALGAKLNSRFNMSEVFSPERDLTGLAIYAIISREKQIRG